MKSLGKLTEFDVLDLLNEYQSEMRKLKHKVDFVKEKIADLENQFEAIKLRKDQARFNKLVGIAADEMIDSSVGDVMKYDSQKSSGVNKKTIKGKSVKKGKKQDRKLQALSQWDNMLIESIADNGKSTLSRDIFGRLREKAIANGVFESDEHVKIKLNQCLVKLTSKRNEIIKVKYAGRGFAYALHVWLNEKGKLPKAYEL